MAFGATGDEHQPGLPIGGEFGLFLTVGSTASASGVITGDVHGLFRFMTAFGRSSFSLDVTLIASPNAEANESAVLPDLELCFNGRTVGSARLGAFCSFDRKAKRAEITVSSSVVIDTSVMETK